MAFNMLDFNNYFITFNVNATLNNKESKLLKNRYAVASIMRQEEEIALKMRMVPSFSHLILIVQRQTQDDLGINSHESIWRNHVMEKGYKKNNIFRFEMGCKMTYNNVTTQYGASLIKWVIWRCQFRFYKEKVIHYPRGDQTCKSSCTASPCRT